LPKTDEKRNKVSEKHGKTLLRFLIGLAAVMVFEGLQINGNWVYRPQEKQKEFHNAILNRADNGYRDFLYGGAARGGKSIALRWEAHRNCLQYPRLRGLLIRSSFPELERSHLAQLPFDLPKEVLSYNSQRHVATYYNDSVLEFGYGDRREDFRQYLSAEYDFIMVDELTTIPFDFSFLLRSRLTASRSEFIPFWACATNPGDVAHVDVRNYFVHKTVLDADRFPNYNPKAIFFLPATVYDNKIVMDRDPGELTRLQQLSKKDQQKFLMGNWDIFEGQFFDEFFADVHIVPADKYLSYEQIKQYNCVAGMDYGNYTAVEWMYKDYNGNVCVFDEFTDIKGVRSVKAAALAEFAKSRTIDKIRIEGDTNLWNPDAFDTDYKTSPIDTFAAQGLDIVKVSKTTKRATDNRGYRIACNDAVRNSLHWEMKDGVLVKKPTLMIYERCHKLIDTLPQLQVDPKNQEDTKDMGDLDTWFDAFKMGFMTLYTPSEPEKPETASQIWERQKKESEQYYTTIIKAPKDWRVEW
jgi:phage terminase large subunit